MNTKHPYCVDECMVATARGPTHACDGECAYADAAPAQPTLNGPKQPSSPEHLALALRHLAVVRELAQARANLAVANERATEWQESAERTLKLAQEARSLLEAERKAREEAETILRAWHSIFGTSQLSHAQARLESAEDGKRRAEQRVATLQQEVERLRPDAQPEPVVRKITCHAPGDRCLGCDHYYGKADVCQYAGASPATAWLITRKSGATELVMSPLTDDTYMREGDEAIPLYAAPVAQRGDARHAARQARKKGT